MNTFRFAIPIITLLALFVSASPSMADTFSFGGAGFTCVGAGGQCNFPGGFGFGGEPVPAGAYIWAVGDSWSQTFATTDASINQLTLDLTLGTDLAVGQAENLDVSINGTDVGTFGEVGESALFGTVTLLQSFSFAPIAGPTYDIALAVDSPGVPGDSGSLGLVTAGGVSTATFSPSSVPEPSSVSLLVIALGALVGLRLLLR